MIYLRLVECRGRLIGAAAICALLSWLVASSWAMGPTFSIDYQGPTVLVPGGGVTADGFGLTFIDEGSILTTTPPGVPGPNPIGPGPLPFPGVMVGSLPGSPGSILGGLGIVPSPAGAVELDALSYGRDFLRPVQTPLGPYLNLPEFSVDEFAVGIPTGFPDVASEGAFGAGEASADTFRYLGPYLGVPPGGPVFGNVNVMDGDGIFPGIPGNGLVEPNPPTPFTLGGDPGDNLDAVDMNSSLMDVMGPIYFSLDAQFPDPLEIPPGAGPPPNTATAVFNGFSSADVLVSFAGGAPGLYIPAPVLGLDLIGPNSDDLDALAFADNGDGIVAPTAPGGGGDEILFSVRRGSAVIGLPDSMFGAPIEEGDILTVPLAGGASPFPAIFLPAEALGLATVRSGLGTAYGLPNPVYGLDLWADDLDALDVVPEPCTGLGWALLAFAVLRRNGK